MTTIADVNTVAREASASKNSKSAASRTTTGLTDAVSASTAAAGPAEDSIRFSSSFSDLVAKQTKEFSDEFIKILTNAGFTLKDSFIVAIKNGRFSVSGNDADNEKIRELFKNNPELEKKFKEILALNTLLAMQEANARHRKEREEAEAVLDPVEREKALKSVDMRHISRLGMIHELSGTLVYKDGGFTSAALNYIRSNPL